MGIPKELTSYKNWVLWKAVKEGDKYRKYPYQLNGEKAKTNNSLTWASFQEVSKKCDHYSGVGFVFSKDNDIVGIDIDHCLIDNDILDEAKNWVERFNSYTEISPSGDGLHILIKTDKKALAKYMLEKYQVNTGKKQAKGECYHSGRYFTVTGKQYNEISSIKNVGLEVVKEFLKYICPEEKNNNVSINNTANTGIVNFSDNEIIDLASKHNNNFSFLYNEVGKPGNSEGDQSFANILAFYTKDHGQIKRIMISSPRNRPKFRKHPTYLNKTINNALSTVREQYNPQYKQDKQGKKENIDTTNIDLDKLISNQYLATDNDYSFLEKRLMHTLLFENNDYIKRYDNIVSKNKIITIKNKLVLPKQILPQSYQNLNEYFVVPVVRAGKIISVLLNGKDNVRGFKAEIFNIDYLNKSHDNLFIVDDIFDCLSLEMMGYSAIAINNMTNKLMDSIKAQMNNIENSKLILYGSSISKKYDLKELGVKCKVLERATEYNNLNDFYLKDCAGLEKLIDELINYKMEKDYILSKFLLDINENRNAKVISSGFKNLDKKLNGGIYPGLYVLGAISSLGKTALGLQIADNIAKENPTIFFSLEMPKNELLSRSISRGIVEQYGYKGHENITTMRILNGKIDNIQNKFNNVLNDYANNQGKNLKIIHGNYDYSIDDIISEVENFIDQTGKKPVVFVDYLQVIKGNKNSRYTTDKERIDNIVVSLKQLSANKNIPVFVISSFNRENYFQVVSFQSFKESGNIEYTADFVLGLELSIMANLTAEKNIEDKKIKIEKAKKANKREITLKILKNRNGKTGTSVNFDFYAANNLFREGIEQTAADELNEELSEEKQTNNEAKNFLEMEKTIDKLVDEIVPDFYDYVEFSGIGTSKKLRVNRLKKYLNEKSKTVYATTLDLGLVTDKIYNLVKTTSPATIAQIEEKLKEVKENFPNMKEKEVIRQVAKSLSIENERVRRFLELNKNK